MYYLDLLLPKTLFESNKNRYFAQKNNFSNKFINQLIFFSL